MLKILMEDLKTSMKEKDVLRKESLQLIISKAKSIAKEKLSEVNNEYIMASINSELKQTKEALEMMRKNLSEKAIADYEYKIKVISGYLPKQLDEFEIKEKIDEAIEELNISKEIKNMGTLIKHLKEKLGNTVDGKLLSEMVKEKLK